MKIPRGQTQKMRAYQKAYRESRPRPDRRAYKAAYDAAHKDEQAAYRKANAARLKAQRAAYYKANRDRLLAAVKARDKANPARVSEYHAEHYERNAGRIKANVSAYRKAYPEKKRHLENRRRARKAGNGGSHTAEQWLALCKEHCERCFYCREMEPLTRDHAIPLKRGGTDDISNIVPACRSCNSRKNAKTLAEYAAIGGIGMKRQAPYEGR
jgi:5-methylcytosine-specific restriction endonuclease McrA